MPTIIPLHREGGVWDFKVQSHLERGTRKETSVLGPSEERETQLGVVFFFFFYKDWERERERRGVSELRLFLFATKLIFFMGPWNPCASKLLVGHSFLFLGSYSPTCCSLALLSLCCISYLFLFPNLTLLKTLSSLFSMYHLPYIQRKIHSILCWYWFVLVGGYKDQFCLVG